MDSFSVFPFVSDLFYLAQCFHAVACIRTSFFFMAKEYPLRLYHSSFILSFIEGYLGYLYLVAIENSTAMNIGMLVSA